MPSLEKKEYHRDYYRTYRVKNLHKLRIYKREWTKKRRKEIKEIILSDQECYFNCGQLLWSSKDKRPDSAACSSCLKKLFKEFSSFEEQTAFFYYPHRARFIVD